MAAGLGAQACKVALSVVVTIVLLILGVTADCLGPQGG